MTIELRVERAIDRLDKKFMAKDFEVQVWEYIGAHRAEVCDTCELREQKNRMIRNLEAHIRELQIMNKSEQEKLIQQTLQELLRNQQELKRLLEEILRLVGRETRLGR